MPSINVWENGLKWIFCALVLCTLSACASSSGVSPGTETRKSSVEVFGTIDAGVSVRR